MAQYVLRPSSFQSNMVGTQYHVGLSNGTVSYGYIFQNDAQSSVGMFEKSNVTDKQALVQYSSPNLIDRDLAYFPRVSQGDFSGGALQTVFLDATKFVDSDLDITTPGYAQLKSTWQRKTVTINSAPATIKQVVSFNQDLYYTFGETNGNVYQANVFAGGAPSSGSPAAAALTGLFTDGSFLFAGQANALYFTTGSLGSWTQIASAVNGSTANKWWHAEEGTNGHFCYYTFTGAGGDSLWKIDLNSSRPVAPGSQPQVPTNGAAIYIVDVVAYQGGIAILSRDEISFNRFDVWFHDGQNMTRIVHVEGYRAMGMCECLGNLYVGTEDFLTFGGPVLIEVGSGSGFQIVARPAIPNLFTGNQVGGAPVSNAEYVYWPIRIDNTPLGLTNPGNLSPTPRILVYNTLTAAVSFYPNLDANDFGDSIIFGSDIETQRLSIGFGASAAFCYDTITGSTGTIQFEQIATENLPVVYQSNGWLVSSKLDFSTPAIPKRFRTIEVHHSPLAAGEAIAVKAFVDQDPLSFTRTLTPVPSGATITNNTLNSSVTTLTFGADTIGRSLYYAVMLTAGTGAQTTPKIIYTAVEVGGTWVWDFQFDCSSKRRTLAQGQPDGQGVTGKDLYFLLRNSYENGNFLTLTLFGGLTYTVAVQSIEARNIGYAVHQQQAVKPDEEWSVHAVLTQVQ